MDFYDVLDQVAALLQKRKRVTYGALKLQFRLDDEQLQVLKEELIEAQRVAADEDGKVLVWVGRDRRMSSVQSLESQTLPFPDLRHEPPDPRPISYTPPHLAERIRAVNVTDGERKTIMALFADLKGSTALIEGLDSGVTCRVFAAQVLWLLGYPEQARQRMQEALTLARELAHPLSIVITLTLSPMVWIRRQEVQLVQEEAEATIALCTELGLGEFWVAEANVWQGWVLAKQGQHEEGIALMRHGMAAFRATGAEIERQYWLALLAEVYAKMGQPEQGRHALAEARAIVDKTGERYWEAELHRLEGELLLQSQVQGPKSKVEEAEEYFQQAIEIAQKQQAKSLELRASMSLARLWQSQDRKAEAHKMLSEVYNWFTEGFDTKDLQEAKALLDALT